MRVGEGRSNSRWPEPCKRTKQAVRQAGRGISWQVGWLAGWLAGGRKEDSGRTGYRGKRHTQTRTNSSRRREKVRHEQTPGGGGSEAGGRQCRGSRGRGRSVKMGLAGV
ncbi:hypothetical protein Pmani_019620 [Petrolisthes manimaculis]|uniref:Uncharacterized protein n=1 Tax=Petrolisthes manimaculis TaxID=1843537 RepID=A0AAE1PK13_9EUCA|nr:hypothetical protein Pmani_019620 [Petrolisthes manimaculis]